MPDYTGIDHSSLLSYVFYPHETVSVCPRWGFDHFVAVSEGDSLHCRFYKENDAYPWILFFHGNGEVISDYDETSLFYMKAGINLVVVDYRGYGKSTGTPAMGTMTADAHAVYASITKELTTRGLRDVPWVMGRSLGSVCALEIANAQGTNVPGLIIESGFASIARLLTQMRIPGIDIDLDRMDGQCLALVAGLSTPTLIIHGEHDTLIPVEEAEVLRDRLGATDKELVIIPGASHNDIMFLGLKQYMGAIKAFIEKTGEPVRISVKA